MYDLEERNFIFSKRIAMLCKPIQQGVISQIYVRQLIRSSSSVGANYIEANESLGSRDFSMKIRICLRELKETQYWLRLLRETNCLSNRVEIDSLITEARELQCIFGAILKNRSKPQKRI
jgi:four helix bundle protein